MNTTTKLYRKKPLNLKEEEQKYFENDFSYMPIESYNWQKKNILISNLYHLQRGFHLLPESYNNAQHIIKQPYLKQLYTRFKNVWLVKNELFTETGIYAINPWSTFYYHWFAETLPRLYSVKKLIEDSYLILPHRFRNLAFVEPSLSFFKIKGIKYLEFNTNLKVKNLQYVSELAQTGSYNGLLTKELYTHIRTHIAKMTPLNLGERIYVSRQKANGRKIINSNEFNACITKHGFIEVFFEDYTWVQQAQIAFHAKHLIGPHGGGLTNALFMQKGSTILELRPKGHFFFNCFYTLADALEHNYYYLTCNTNNPNNPHASDFIVDIEELNITLQKVING
jgi:capsular polysaccharide biosynthesis protein